MEKSVSNINKHLLNIAVNAELEYLSKINASNNLLFLYSNLGAFEALLHIIKSGDDGLPIYTAVGSVFTSFCGQAGIINRLRVLRNLELLDEKPGRKKSQVCLVPTEKLLQEIGPILCDRHQGIFH